MLCTELGSDGAVGAELGGERIPHSLQEVSPLRQFELEVSEATVHSVECETPAEVRAGVFREGTQKFHRGVAVRVKKLLHEPDTLRAAVAFHLALIRVELQTPDASITYERCNRCL